MKKTAAEIAKDALEDVYKEGFLDGFFKRASELGLPLDSGACVEGLLKTAARLEELDAAVAPIIEPLRKEANEKLISDALVGLDGVTAADIARTLA